MSRAFINLPFATHPTEFTEGSEQNLVLLQSLRQSREKWISSAFPKFSSTTRQTSKSSKNQIPNSPPHTIQSRGKCDLAIGPHIFYDTKFYEVHYLQQSTYYSSAYSSILSPSLNPATMMITPEIVNQVNSAASSNPTLANLLQLAAAGKASPDQLKTLGLLVQSLAASNPVFQLPGTTSSALPASTVATTNLNSQTPAPAASTSSAPVPQAPTQHSFDLIIEFRENNTERWFLPRGTASVVASPENPTNITVTALLPFSKSNFNFTSTMLFTEDTEDRLIELELTNTPPTIHDSLWRWAGGEAKSEVNRQILDKEKFIRRTYLSYEVPEDPDLLMQLQLATAPPNPLKSIKPSGNLYKRPSAPRKRPAKAKEPISRIVISSSVATPTPAPTTVTSPVPPSVESVPADSTPLDPPLALAESSATPVSPTVNPLTVTPIPMRDLNPTFFAPLINNNNKKPRQSRQPKQPKKQKMKSPPPVIRCLSCGQTDVPLLLGGRFCRPCVEGGRANAEIPQAPLMRSGMAHTTAALKLSPFPSSPNASSSGAVIGSVQQPQSAQGTPPSTTGVGGGGGGTGTTTDVDMSDGGTSPGGS